MFFTVEFLISVLFVILANCVKLISSKEACISFKREREKFFPFELLVDICCPFELLMEFCPLELLVIDLTMGGPCRVSF